MVKRTSTEAFHNKDTVEVRKVNLYHSISAWLMENALTKPGEWVEITLPFWSKKNYPWRFFVAHKFNFFFISDLGSALGTLGCAKVTEMCKIEPAELRMHEPGALLCCSSDDVIDVVDTFFRFLNKLIAIKSIPKEQSNSDTNKKETTMNKQDNVARFREKILSCSRVISEREKLRTPPIISPFKFPWLERKQNLTIKVRFCNDCIELWDEEYYFDDEDKDELKAICDKLGVEIDFELGGIGTKINYHDDRDTFFDKVMNLICAMYDIGYTDQLHGNYRTQ